MLKFNMRAISTISTPRSSNLWEHNFQSQKRSRMKFFLFRSTVQCMIQK